MRSTNSFIVFCALAIMLLGIFGSAFILFDEERLKALVAEQVEAHAGRRIDIRGELKVRLFPGLRLSADRIVLSGPRDFEGPMLMSADRLDMQVRLLPLIRGIVDATSVDLGGVRLNLHTDASGISSLDGLLSLADVSRPSPSWTSGPIVLEDLTVSLSDSESALRESFEIERMELDGFAVGQPLQFRYRGNLGEPAIFDELEIDGLLVSSESGQLRLSNMRLAGIMDGGRYQLEILGGVSVRARPEINLLLEDGRLRLNQHEFELGMRYRGTERPMVSLDLAAENLDVDVMILLDRIMGVPYQPADSAVLTALRGLDFDARLEVGQAGDVGLVLEGLSMVVTGYSGSIEVESLVSSVPSGVLNGRARLDLRYPEPFWMTSFQADLSRLQPVLSALGREWRLDGSGQIRLDLETLAPVEASEAVRWTGSGHIELWDGTWSLLHSIFEEFPGHGENGRFDTMRSELLLQGDSIMLRRLAVLRDTKTLGGEVSMLMSTGELDGLVHLVANGDYSQLELGGTLDYPDLVASPVTVRPTQ
jgi:AsmA protein